MLSLALSIFLVVAVAGDVMAVLVYLKRPIPAYATRAHMIAAAVGLAVLLLALLSAGGSQLAWIALGIFAAGFAGGYLMFAVMFAGKRAPLWAIAAHGSLGWAGIVVLFLGL
jgi:hypothetical protein